MPKPIPTAIRHQVVTRHQAGESLKALSLQFGIPYESVRNIWRLYRTEGRVEADYKNCGRQGLSASPRIYRGALYLKKHHPSWGAGLIRQLLQEKWPSEHLPHERSLQRWFRAAKLQPRDHEKPTGEARRGRGKAPHNIWEMDSREQITLADKSQVSWLLVSDEHSGAILEGRVFPPSQG